jgi:hypothetical protein
MSDVPASARTPRGYFAPGTSGNPGGRIGLPSEIRERLEAGVPEAVDRLLDLVRSEDDRIALAASEALLSRLYGRPAQQVDATIKTTSIGQAHLQALQEIAARREARLRSAPPTTIEI